MAEDPHVHLVRSEIADSLGDKTLARTELEAVTVDETTPPPIVEAYYQHADGLYRGLDDREALIAVCRQLSANGALSLDEQLRYARAAVRAMSAWALLRRRQRAPHPRSRRSVGERARARLRNRSRAGGARDPGRPRGLRRERPSPVPLRGTDSPWSPPRPHERRGAKSRRRGRRRRPRRARATLHSVRETRDPGAAELRARVSLDVDRPRVRAGGG